MEMEPVELRDESVDAKAEFRYAVVGFICLAPVFVIIAVVALAAWFSRGH